MTTEAGRVDTPRSERTGSAVPAVVACPPLELDVRLLGMLIALAVLWLTFNLLSDGRFLTPRFLWNLSVQSAAVAVMTTGMVLIIVSRNIDLSVGSDPRVHGDGHGTAPGRSGSPTSSASA